MVLGFTVGTSVNVGMDPHRGAGYHQVSKSMQTSIYSDHHQSDASCQKACQPAPWQHGFQENLDSSGSEGVTVLSGSALEQSRVA